MTLEQSEILHREVLKLNPSPVVELFELDVRPCAIDSVLYFQSISIQDALRFHNGSGGMRIEHVRFKNNAYQPLPIRVKGFEFLGTGEPPRPTLSIMNVGGFMSSLILQTKDLVGATLTRRRTFARFLDGSVDASPIEYPPDIFRVVQKTREDRIMVEFELGSGLDLDGVKYPVRTITADYCQHVYRGPGCRFAGTYVVADRDGVAFRGMTKFRGNWDASVDYAEGETVWFAPTQGVHLMHVPGTVKGENYNPYYSAYWERIQRYRGEFDSAGTDYVQNDVVFVSSSIGRTFYIALTPTVPTGVTPPNAVFWKACSCSKNLTNCRYRFDPFVTNANPLPYGGFTGTLTIPEV